MGILANSNAIGGGNYLIERSLRFQSASSQYLSRTPASATNRKTWTWSGWVKRGKLGSAQPILDAQTVTPNTYQFFQFTSSDTIQLKAVNSGTTVGDLTTSAVYRDPSAWYHIVVTWDSANSTAANRWILYVNGIQQSVTTTTTVTQNTDGAINFNIAHFIASNVDQTSLFDGYMTEVNFIDGQALTPSSFGETDAATGVWIAKRYTGTYGTNGFYLKFNDGTSTTTLGQDRSGNANNWTLTNFTRSAGVSDCWMYDVPSGNGSPTATQPSSNYAVMNPLDNNSMTLSAANLDAVGSTTYGAVRSTMAVSSGKYYFEVNVLQNVSGNFLGIAPTTSVFNTSTIYPNALAIDNSTIGGIKTVGVTIDFDNLECKFYVNNSLASTQTIVAANAPYAPFVADGSSGNNASYSINFGQRSFAYTPPSGFKALCTANLPTPTIAKGNQYMDARLYTGDGTSPRNILQSGNFTPDFFWLKQRSTGRDHFLFDRVRGKGTNSLYTMFSNATNADSDSLGGSGNASDFSGTGLTITQGTTNTLNLNENTGTYVAWLWKAGDSTVTNTSGSISSQVRANTTAGFSIVTYTGTGANATVGHGLGVAPKLIIVKSRAGAGTQNWAVYHANSNATPQNYYLFLSDTRAATALATMWNNTAPTSSVFSIGTNSEVNTSTATYVSYCFSEVAGFSKIGSYTGNGSTDGPFVYCGFRPKFILWKSATEAATLWNIFDTTRTPANVVGEYLNPNTSNAEGTATLVDILSNGFKLRTSGAGNNANAATYIFMAFAENPFNYSNAR